MSTRKFLLAVSPDPALDRQLAGDAPATLRRYPSILAATVATPPVYPFVHTCDPDLARTWLRYATRRSSAELAALAPAEQIRAVVEAWDAFGRAFQAFNLRPYGWKRLRQRCEWAWGGVPPGDNPAAPSSPTYWQGRFLEEDMLSRGEPGQWGGAWRVEGMALAASQRARGLEDMLPNARSVVFGGEDDWRMDNVGCSPSDAYALPDACYAPTGEVHRLWLQNNGTLSGSKLYTEAEIARQFSYGVGVGWDRWAAEPSTPYVGSNRLYFLPPLRWYWELLFAPVRGLQVPGYRPTREDAPPAVAVGGGPATGRILGMPAGYDPNLDLSLAEYLLALDPLDVVREVSRDVVLRNATMAGKNGIHDSARVSQLIAQAGVELADAEEESNRDFQTLTTAGFSIATTLTAINPLAGLIAGGVTAAAAVIFKTVEKETRRIDVFGRLMPTYEALAYTDNETQFIDRLNEIGTPPETSGGASFFPLGPIALPARLTVTVDAPDARVAVNGPGEDNAAFPAPWGPRSVTPGVPLTIRVEVPGRTPRTLAVNLLPRENRVLDVAGESLELATRPEPSNVPVRESPGESPAWPFVVSAVALAAAGGLGWWAWRRTQARQNPRKRRRR